jgi:CRP-like cAMP-binding protein
VTAATRVSRLAESECAVLSEHAARATWPAGFNIYQRGAPADGVFVVTRGRVVLRSRVRSARGFVPWIATPGETFGSEGLGREGHYLTDARADAETDTLFLSGQRMRAFVREQPQHALALVGQLMSERSILLERLRELTTLSVEQRLVTALARLGATGTFTRDDGRIELLPQRYRLLCEMVGATRESVSLVLGRLATDGLVERKGASLIVAPLSRFANRLDDGAFDAAASFPAMDEGAGQAELH